MPGLSGKGIIAVKNPNNTEDCTNLLHHFLKNKKHKRVSLVDIIFLVCHSSEFMNTPLIFEMDQLVQA